MEFLGQLPFPSTPPKLQDLPELFERGLVDNNGCRVRLPIPDAEYEVYVQRNSTMAKVLQPQSSLMARRVANMVAVALQRTVVVCDEIRLARKFAPGCLTGIPVIRMKPIYGWKGLEPPCKQTGLLTVSRLLGWLDPSMLDPSPNCSP